MAKKLKVGDVLRGYRITKVFGPGMMAISYGAVAPDGRKVFFKQYKSPAPTVVWYDAFVAYQHELSRRVREGKVGHFAVRQLDAFEERWGGACYFQAYEFVENGADLQKILDDERERHRATGVAPTRDPAVWARHVTWAKVLVAAIAALHEARVVHADLKPANAYLIDDPSLGAGYQLKLIDMDFSVLADRKAPWHGFQGYVGSDNYRSPEHLARRSVPTPASDVFTCGLMLYELLSGEHPYWREDQAEYARLVQSHAAKPPPLAGPMPAAVDGAALAALLHRCLSPDADARPTAAQLRAALSGRGDRPAVATGTTGGTRPAAPAAARPAAPAASGTVRDAPGAATAAGVGRASAPASAARPLTSAGIELLAPDGSRIRVGVRTELGKSLLRRFGDDSAFWDDRQCVLERPDGRAWVVTPVPGTTNETLVNGRAITAPRVLEDDDAIAVGRQARGIVKLPLVVRALR